VTWLGGFHIWLRVRVLAAYGHVSVIVFVLALSSEY